MNEQNETNKQVEPAKTSKYIAAVDNIKSSRAGKELVTEIFKDAEKVGALIEGIVVEARSMVADPKTAKGRKMIASNAFKVSRSSTYLDDIGKEAVSAWKKQSKVVDVQRKRMRDALASLKAEVRAPLTAWENAEKARVSKILSAIEGMEALAATGPDDVRTSEQLAVALAAVHAVEINAKGGQAFGEYTQKALDTKGRASSTLVYLIKTRQEAEKAQARLDQLLKEKKEKEREERDEKIRAAARKEAEKNARDEAAQARAIAAQEEAARLAEVAAAGERRRRQAEQVQELAHKRVTEALEKEKAKVESDLRAAEQRAYFAENQGSADLVNAVPPPMPAAGFIETKTRLVEEAPAVPADKLMMIEKEAADGLVVLGLDRIVARAVVIAIRKGRVPHIRIY